ncbi:hypothetical protein ACIGZJ_31805 [Kitasatospora sp. NPDC052868]|uniref:hypothetical protein n=1 Tax=Kitasatospora sp. NPDC052868 TaxID=3364060 RepID=UPI0037C8EB98
MKTRPPETDPDERASASEQFLFGGRLRYDYGFTSHEQAILKIDFLTAARQIPGMLRTALALRGTPTAPPWWSSSSPRSAAPRGWSWPSWRTRSSAGCWSPPGSAPRHYDASSARASPSSPPCSAWSPPGRVLLTLDPVLMPMPALIAAPKGWGAVRSARRRYASVTAWPAQYATAVPRKRDNEPAAGPA